MVPEVARLGGEGGAGQVLNRSSSSSRDWRGTDSGAGLPYVAAAPEEQETIWSILVNIFCI